MWEEGLKEFNRFILKAVDLSVKTCHQVCVGQPARNQAELGAEALLTVLKGSRVWWEA